MTVLGAVLAGVVGLAVGSFLTVVAHRVPQRLSVVAPRSACPRCGTTIRWYDNVPVVSWVLLRGRCRECAAPISARYLAIESGTAALFVAMALRFPVGSEAGWALPAYLYLAGLAVVLTVIDLAERRLPDAIVLPSYPVAAVLLVAASGGSGDWSALGRAAVGGVILWALYFVLMVVRPGGMGFGDVKLAGLIGTYLAWLGWGTLVVGAFAAFLLGGLFAVALLLTGRAGRASRIPFGPWMLLGALIGVGAGEAVWTAYLGSIG